MNKPGLLTTEFWMAITVIALGAIASQYAESPIAQMGGQLAAALAAAGYGFSRSKVKGAEVQAIESINDNESWKARDQAKASQEVELANIAANKEIQIAALQATKENQS